MARGVNKVILVGNLGSDPEIRYTQNGTAVSQLSLATNERVKRNGEWTDRVEWHRIVAWGKLAEFAGNHLRKGNLVYVEGRLQTRHWEDRDGARRAQTEVVAHALRPLGPFGNGARNGHPKPAEGPAPDATAAEDPLPFDDDDVPF
ncbi:MAG TPA: single-stranded DNA-binding protein [Bryobacterales bacterium]|nr:single-stranded DNA-binding protein [Bryobacterales bacterium]